MVRRALCGAVCGILLVGCAAIPKDTWRCTENRCEMTVSGSPTVEVLGARLKTKVTGGRIRVSGGGVDVTLNPGEAAIVDGVRVEVRSVDGGVAAIVVTEQKR